MVIKGAEINTDELILMIRLMRSAESEINDARIKIIDGLHNLTTDIVRYTMWGYFKYNDVKSIDFKKDPRFVELREVMLKKLGNNLVNIIVAYCLSSDNIEIGPSVRYMLFNEDLYNEDNFNVEESEIKKYLMRIINDLNKAQVKISEHILSAEEMEDFTSLCHFIIRHIWVLARRLGFTAKDIYIAMNEKVNSWIDVKKCTIIH